MTARDFWIALEQDQEKGLTLEQIERRADHMEDTFELMEMFAEYKINQLKPENDGWIDIGNGEIDARNGDAFYVKHADGSISNAVCKNRMLWLQTEGANNADIVAYKPWGVWINEFVK